MVQQAAYSFKLNIRSLVIDQNKQQAKKRATKVAQIALRAHAARKDQLDLRSCSTFLTK